MGTTSAKSHLLFFFVFGVLVVFARGFLEAFDLTKAIWAWSAGVIVLWVMVISLTNHSVRGPSLVKAWWPLGALWGAAALVSVLSPDLKGSLAGQDHRFTGLVTITACILLAAYASTLSSSSLVRGFQIWTIPTTLIIAGYAILQSSGNDPFRWAITSFGGSPFSTLGNPNVLAATVALLMPMTFYAMTERGRVGERIVFEATFILLTVAGSMADSFQVLFGIVGAGCFLLMHSRSESGKCRIAVSNLADLAILLITTLILLSPIRGDSYVSLLLVFGIVVFGTGYYRRSLEQRRLTEVPYVFVALITLGSVPLIWLLLRKQIDSAAYERSAFYRAVWSAFLDRPLWGHGLENFGAIYPQYRPQWHASELQNSLTNSPHSILYGTLATGGAVLFLASGAFFGVAFYRTWKRWTSGSDTHDAAAIFSSILSVALIFLVSVESVPLFVLGYSIVGGGLRRDLEEKRQARRSSRRRQSIRLPQMALVAGSCLLSIFIIIGGRPTVLAEVKLQDGMDYLYLEGRPDLAEPILKEVVRLRPDESRYRLELANSLLAQAKYDLAINELMAAIEESNFNTNLVVDISRIYRELGRTDLADFITSEARKRDKYAPALR